MLTAYVPGRSACEADLALKSASRAEAAARQCAVLWFGEILERGLFRELGYSSMPAYARAELGYSETRIFDFMRLVQKLERLPAVKAALPEIGYTKAREIIQVASPRTQAKWVEEARTSSRAELVQKVKRLKAQAGAKPAAVLFAPPRDEPLLAEEVPVRVSVEFTPEQHARWEALWEQARRRGGSSDRAEMLLEAMQCFVSSYETAGSNADIFPQGKRAAEAPGAQGIASQPAPDTRNNTAPPVQIHVHQCPDCGKSEVNGRPLGRVDSARLRCDAAIARPGARNTTTIPPKTRREVLARDRHRCQAPGCGRARFLEVHHRTPRTKGGTNDAANLVTLCAACHRLWHERQGLTAPMATLAPAPPATRAAATSPGASPPSHGR